MNSSVTRVQPVGVALPEPEPEEALGLSRLPPELLLMLLSHVPPRTLIRHCRRVCRRWRALVDCQALWLIILARDHCALWPIAQSRLPSARNDAHPCILGRFCERRPIGRNLIQNPKGEGREPRKGDLAKGDPASSLRGGLPGTWWAGQELETQDTTGNRE